VRRRWHVKVDGHRPDRADTPQRDLALAILGRLFGVGGLELSRRRRNDARRLLHERERPGFVKLAGYDQDDVVGLVVRLVEGLQVPHREVVKGRRQGEQVTAGLRPAQDLFGRGLAAGVDGRHPVPVLLAHDLSIHKGRGMGECRGTGPFAASVLTRAWRCGTHRTRPRLTNLWTWVGPGEIRFKESNRKRLLKVAAGRFMWCLLARDVPLAGRASGQGGRPLVSIRRCTMLRWAVVFLVLALVAAFLGFGGIAGQAGWIAEVLCVVFVIFAVVSFVLGRGSPPVE
jgi:uncharacterized membrane protein YtjA (UPF0391 family)